jgi:hypothetical protein
VHVNHADHCYWLGRETADLVVSHREVGSKIARERRGMPDERTALLPLPLESTTASGEREQARHELGIAPGQVVLLTVGTSYKFGPIGGPHFLDAAEPVVAANPSALLIAVGPSNTGRFAEARQRTGGRVCAVGRLEKLDNMYAAADVYLESYPCSSGTAVREAAAHGTPVLTFAPDPVEAEMLGSDASLADVWQRAANVDDYASIAADLIADPVARARWGAAARDSVAESFDEERWAAMVEDVYRQAVAVGPVRPEELSEPSGDQNRYDTIVHRIHAYTDKQIPITWAEALADQLELVARSPAARAAFGRLAGPTGSPDQRLRYPVALAAPVADARVVNATIQEFRRLALSGIVESFRLSVAPALVDEVVPLVEAALAAGPDVDIDLVTVPEPRNAYEPGTLVVTAEGDAFGDLPPAEYPQQHRAA